MSSSHLSLQPAASSPPAHSTRPTSPPSLPSSPPQLPPQLSPPQQPQRQPQRASATSPPARSHARLLLRRAMPTRRRRTPQAPAAEGTPAPTPERARRSLRSLVRGADGGGSLPGGRPEEGGGGSGRLSAWLHRSGSIEGRHCADGDDARPEGRRWAALRRMRAAASRSLSRARGGAVPGEYECVRESDVEEEEEEEDESDGKPGGGGGAVTSSGTSSWGEGSGVVLADVNRGDAAAVVIPSPSPPTPSPTPSPRSAAVVRPRRVAAVRRPSPRALAAARPPLTGLRLIFLGALAAVAALLVVLLAELVRLRYRVHTLRVEGRAGTEAIPSLL